MGTRVDELILGMVLDAWERLTPHELRKRVQKELPLKRGQFGSAIKRLIGKKALIYTYQFGNSFLEPSFDKPVRVAKFFILKPPVYDYRPLPGDIVITIRPGAAFGNGFHPTTRLCLKGLETVCAGLPACENDRGGAVLDIGTGSGVLMIAALKMGMDRGIGLDIDPCARVEARENVALNNLLGQAEISNRALDAIKEHFQLVVANLRLPTLKVYFEKMIGLMAPGGCMVLSGIKSNEIGLLQRISENYEVNMCWQGIERGWGALALVENGHEKDHGGRGCRPLPSG